MQNMFTGPKHLSSWMKTYIERKPCFKYFWFVNLCTKWEMSFTRSIWYPVIRVTLPKCEFGLSQHTIILFIFIFISAVFIKRTVCLWSDLLVNCIGLLTVRIDLEFDFFICKYGIALHILLFPISSLLPRNLLFFLYFHTELSLFTRLTACHIT